MEYKLSKSEFYRIGYLLAGLFMFLFLFGIFNLSSYGDGTITPINYNFNALNYNGVDVPAFSYTISGTGHFTYVGAGGSSYFAEQSFYVVTENGAINIANYTRTFYGTTRQDITFSYSGTSLGKPINAFVESNDLSGGYGVFVWDTLNLSITVVDWADYILGGGSSSSSFSDYSSFSLVNSLTNVEYYSSFNSNDLLIGDVIQKDFDDISTSNLTPTPMWTGFSHLNNDKFLFVFYVEGPPHALDTYFSSVNLRVYSYASGYRDFYWSDFKNVRLDVLPSGKVGLSFSCEFDMSAADAVDPCAFYFTANSSVTCTRLSYSLFAYKATIADYMDYVKDNWNNISPSVTDTNQNIAQSVSDIGTAQTFETSAFSDFDTSMTTSGLDTFSLSFTSTPLLWCASIINTFYNNMPSGFQYLLMFVAFVGILVIVLNIAGRVVRRFGGD